MYVYTEAWSLVNLTVMSNKDLSMSDEELYLVATNEIDGNNKNLALWAKAMALADGDTDIAKYKYIKLRVEQLIAVKVDELSVSTSTISSSNEPYPYSLFDGLTHKEVLESINKPFDDKVNYPHGFRRSGVFSIESSEILRDRGRRLLAIQCNYIEPEAEEEDLFKDYLSGMRKADSAIETAWEKYISSVSKEAFIMFQGGSKGSLSSGDYADGSSMYKDESDREDREVDYGYKDDEGYS